MSLPSNSHQPGQPAPFQPSRVGGAGGSRQTAARRLPTAQRTLEPVHVIALAGLLSTLLYALAFVRPYGLLQYWHQPLLDLQRISNWLPNARTQLALAFVAQAVLYAIGWRAAQGARGRGAWALVLGGFLAMSLVLIFLLPFDAADIFDNIVHGRILGIYGQNPFVVVGGQFPRDPFVPYMAWAYSPSAYGPFWEVMAALTARLAGNSILANVVAFKLLGGLFLLGSVLLVASMLREVAPERALAGTLLIAWNPIILYETIGHGHNDIAMVFWVLAAARALLNRSYTTAILALLGGALVKFIPMLFLPAAGLIALRDVGDNRARLRFVLVTAVSSVAIIVAAYAVFWHGASTLTIDRRETMLTTSLPAFIWAWLLQAGRMGGRSPDEIAKIISWGAAALTVVFALLSGLRALRDRSWLSFTRSALHVSLFYLLVTCVWFQNWYMVWPLGLAALLPTGIELALTQFIGFAALSKPLIFAPMVLWRTPFPNQVWRELRLGPAVLSLPWVASLLAMAGWRLRRVPRAPQPLAPRLPATESPDV